MSVRICPTLRWIRGGSPSGCSVREPRHCFRVVPGRLAVEESRDGRHTWRLAWEVPEAERVRLAGTYPRLGDITEDLSSGSLVVLDPSDDGVVVLVANGRDGLARREVDGTWERIGFGVVVHEPSRVATYRPEPVPGLTPQAVVASASTPAVYTMLVASVVIWIGAGVALARLGRTAMTGVGAMALLATMPLWACLWGLLGLPIASLLLGCLLLGYAVVVTIVAARYGALTRIGAARVLLAGVLAYALVFSPYVLRATVAWPTEGAAQLAALTIAGLVVIASVPLAVIHSRHRL